MQFCGAVARALLIGVKIGGLDGVRTGSESKMVISPNWVGGGADGEIMIYYSPKFFRKGKQ